MHFYDRAFRSVVFNLFEENTFDYMKNLNTKINEQTTKQNSKICRVERNIF